MLVLIERADCMKPRIGITSSVNKRDYESDDRDVVMLPWNYPSIVEQCGGLPLILSEGGDPDGCVSAIDALIVAGGRDIDPATYGRDSMPETNDVRPSQDLWELALIDSAKKKGLPILGICRGHQLMAVSYGGFLHQHLPSTSPYEKHGAWGGKWSNHEVIITPESKLSKIIGLSSQVNSAHHQGVSDPGDLEVNARSEDGLIEGLEDPSQKFVMSVQWHPEALGQESLVSALVQAAI